MEGTLTRQQTDEFTIMLGQDGDDYIGGTAKSLIEAKTAADDFAGKIPAGSTTYIYILTPNKKRIDISLREETQ